ncbi:MAG: DUF1800 domain-containing protein [Ignavibacteria bacterium]|nr:DUF1800 domain-containing protein [Ignavibacteria bacterium]
MKLSTGLLDPYIPAPSRPWNKRLITHLLGRTTFGVKVSDVNSLLSLTPGECVDLLFQSLPLPEPPGTWITDPPDYQDPQNGPRMRALPYWWLKVIYQQPVSFRERMTLFWHNNFTSEGTVVKIPQHMYIQNTLFRTNAFGNFKNLTKLVTRDPAMLYYLDGRLSTVNNPNENYSRELLELFTIGIGHYTENDVQEGARALTGWIINGLTSQFVLNRHDNGQKTFLGQTGNFDDEDIADIIFSQHQTAITFCAKIYRNFINQKEDMSYAMPVINEMAEMLRSNNYELEPLLKTILKSQLFFSENVINSIYKSPVEVFMSAVRQMNITLNVNNLNAHFRYISTESSTAGQSLFFPPNVQGWKGFRDWINTLSLPVRSSFLESIITGLKKDNTPTGFSVDPLAFANSFTNPNDAVLLVDQMCEHLVRHKLSAKQKSSLLLVLLDGSEIYDWSINDPEAPSRILKFLKAVMYMAEYQLT